MSAEEVSRDRLERGPHLTGCRCCQQALSFPFSLIFGSGTLGDKMGVPSERGQVDDKPFADGGKGCRADGE